MPNSRTRNLATTLEHSGSTLLCRIKVEVIPSRLPDETSKNIQISTGSRRRGKCMTIAGERGGRRGGRCGCIVGSICFDSGGKEEEAPV
jgi:hypothetical protein